MNPAAIHPLPAIGLEIAMNAHSPAITAKAHVWRRSSTVKSWVTLCWVVGISGSFLVVGLIGLMAANLPPIHLRSLEADMADEQAVIETSMAELLTLETAEEMTPEEETVLPVEIPEAIENPPETLDLPELAEAMTLEDIFAIPTAPKIEDALRPVDPVVKPKPAPAPPSTQSVARSSTSSSTPRTGAVSGSGTGGTTGSGKGKFPSPPYPSFARGAGMQGTVRLSISVGPSGAVESVTVMGSTGFSALDEYAASWVRRNWRWPGGSANRYTLPLTFKLR